MLSTTKTFGLALAAGLFVLSAGNRADACIVDTDCTTGATCGGQVCTFPGGVCVDAGTNPGWCHIDADCKCMGEGATCGLGDTCSCTDPTSCASSTASSSSASTSASTGASSSSASTGATTTTTGSGGNITCDHDTQCPDKSCGGEVCSWESASHHCVAANTGDPGWCNTNADCKCHGDGATCDATAHCTFTTPGGSNGGGDTGAGGSGTTGASGGCSVGSSEAAGTSLFLGLLAFLGLASRRRTKRASA